LSEYDWAADQGDKWLAQLSGLEAMMKEIDAPLLEALPLTTLQPNGAPIRIADIASGGGGTTFEVEKLAPQNSVIHGYDISSALVESANVRAKKQGSRATFETANLQTSPQPNEKYDYLVSRFGMMFFDQPSDAFSNIHNWLKPYGQFAIAVWGDPKQKPWMSALREVAGQYVDLPKPERSAPGPFRYSDTDLLLQELDTACFKHLKIKGWRGQLPLGGGLNAADATSFALAMFTIREPLIEAGGSVFEDASKALTGLLKSFEKDGQVMMDAYLHIITGSV
jgi:SAM-dependent methyltransferase